MARISFLILFRDILICVWAGRSRASDAAKGEKMENNAAQADIGIKELQAGAKPPQAAIKKIELHIVVGCADARDVTATF